MNGLNNRILLLLCFFALMFQESDAQNVIDLSQIKADVIQHSTQASQSSRQKESLDLAKSLAKIQYMPKLSLGAMASYQTDVTSIPLSFPGIEIPSPQKDQYKASLDLQQLIYDGGSTRASLNLSEANGQVEVSKILYDKQKLMESTERLFYSALSIQSQIEHTSILQSQLTQKLEKVNENVKQGTLSKLAYNQLKVKLLELDQQQVLLNQKYTATKEALSILSGKSLGEADVFQLPEMVETLSDNNSSPEIQLLKSQQGLVQASQALNQTKYNPKLSLGASLAYGRPGLNFLSRDFDTYGIASVNLKVPLDHFYTRQKKLEDSQSALQLAAIDDQLSNLERSLDSRQVQLQADVNSLKSALANDDALLALRQEIADATEVQFDNGVITERDYIDELENLRLARNAQALHRIQLAQAIDQINLLKGNF